MNERQSEFLELAKYLVERKGKNEVEVLTSQYPVETSFGELHLGSPALRGLEKRGHIEIIESFWRGALIRLTDEAKINH
jgi:hypothetical protein